MRKATINYAKAATLIASGATLAQAAQECGAQSAGSLRVGLSRRNVTIKAIKCSEGNLIRIKGVASQVLAQESERIKGDFAELLRQHVSKLKDAKPSSNLRKAKEFADVLEPFARTAAKVHGWGDEQAQGLIVAMKQADSDYVDVDTSVADCGVEATTGSVPDSQAI